MNWPFCRPSVVADTEAMQLRINLHSQAFEPLTCLQHWQQQLQALGHPASAAESLFVGRVRAEAADGSALEALELEHYPGMTENQLQQLAST